MASMGTANRDAQLRPRERGLGKAFVARTDDLSRLDQLFADGVTRVTVVGPPGVGKSTLAARYQARAKLNDERLLTGYCRVGETRGHVDLRGVAGRALGIPDLDTGDEEAGAERFRRAVEGAERALLVLDGADSVLTDARLLLDDWLDEIPALRVLVTSRQRLRVLDERVHELAPLSVPTGDTLDGSAAVDLWTARVRERFPSYSIGASEAPSIARLVRELDGLPLAIELAAARFGTIAPGEMVERLERTLDVLGVQKDVSGPASSGPERARSSLQRALDLSWQLLEPWERDALAQCSVFRGRITLEAAEIVLDLSGSDSPRTALEALEALRDRSLLAWTLGEEGGGEAQLTTLASVRRYAQEKLRATDYPEAPLARHSRYFVDYAERAAAWAPADPAMSARVLHQERPNLMAVVRRAWDGGVREDVDAALRVLLALEAPRWHLDAPCLHLASLDRTLDLPIASDPSLRARALVARGRIAWRVGRLETSDRDLEEAVRLALEVGDPMLESLTKRFLALAHVVRGRFERARALATEARRLAVQGGDLGLEALATSVLGYVARLTGDSNRARELLDEALALFLRAGDRRLEQFLRVDVAYAHLDAGDVRMARSCVERLVARGPEPPIAARLALCLGHAALLESDAEAAEEHYSAAREMARAAGEVAIEMGAVVGRVVALFDQGRTFEARVQMLEQLPVIQRSGRNAYSVWLDLVTVILEVARPRFDEARRVLARSELEADEDGPDAVVRRLGIALCRAMVDVVEARSRGSSPGDRESEVESAARTMLEGAVVSARDPSAHWIVETRILVRLLGGVLATDRSDVALERCLKLDADGRWFQPPGGERVECGNRPVMRRILLALSAARSAEPPRRITPAELLQAGWPDQRIQRDAGRNRLHVMLTRMRDLGLRSVLAGDDTGYYLAEDLRVELVGPSPSR